MKPIVIFYSRTGTVKKVAKYIAKNLSCQEIEIVDLTDRSGLWGYLIGGRDAIIKIVTEIEPINKNLSKFSLVIVGTPVWGATVSPAIRSFLMKNKNSIKKIAFFCTSSGSAPDHTFKEMENLSRAPKATLHLTTREISQNKYFVKTDEFLEKIKKLK